MSLSEKLAELDKYAKRAADAREAATLADHKRKVVLAKLMKQYEARGVSTAAAQEREARADPEYLEAIIELAKSEGERYRTQYEHLHRRDMLSVWQTMRADRRKELETLPGTGAE